MSEDARRLFAAPCAFVCAASQPEHFEVPEPALSEIAFIGRSNVGKSSLVNALTGRKTLARTSNTPGRTQQIVFFDLGGRLRLVDLPGYGFAKAPPAALKQWEGLVKVYLRRRCELALVCVLVDARRGLLDVDERFMRFLDENAVPYLLVFTKGDLLKSAEEELLSTAREALKAHPAARPEALLTSAAKGDGIEALRTLLAPFASEAEGER